MNRSIAIRDTADSQSKVRRPVTFDPCTNAFQSFAPHRHEAVCSSVRSKITSTIARVGALLYKHTAAHYKRKLIIDVPSCGWCNTLPSASLDDVCLVLVKVGKRSKRVCCKSFPLTHNTYKFNGVYRSRTSLTSRKSLTSQRKTTLRASPVSDTRDRSHNNKRGKRS